MNEQEIKDYFYELGYTVDDGIDYDDNKDTYYIYAEKTYKEDWHICNFECYLLNENSYSWYLQGTNTSRNNTYPYYIKKRYEPLTYNQLEEFRQQVENKDIK